jgi:hypothetical protein
MAHPQVADGGDSHQIWMVSVNMLNNMFLQLEGCTGGNNNNCKIVACYEMSQRAFDLNRFFSMTKQQKERQNVDVGIILKWIL